MEKAPHGIHSDAGPPDRAEADRQGLAIQHEFGAEIAEILGRLQRHLRIILGPVDRLAGTMIQGKEVEFSARDVELEIDLLEHLRAQIARHPVAVAARLQLQEFHIAYGQAAQMHVPHMSDVSNLLAITMKMDVGRQGGYV